MDLEDRRILRGRNETAPKTEIICHDDDRKNNRHKAKTYNRHRHHRKTTTGKSLRCPDIGTTTKIQKMSRFNPLMTVLMSSRPQHDRPNGNTATEDDSGRTGRTPLTNYRTVVLELPEHLLYKPHKKSSAPLTRGPVARKCRVPDPEKLKINLRW
ncbi:Hypothetical protein CINCED_3A011343 [Cinara cedri]|uniref:Uncharacterized protein n=1 Tax=Cinara cedri TaxID=506608 RepID=A0A5E4MQP8_9HEMI|nr:Hypothetical protein CINCED_3A011343 [Cinara cedri]